MDQRPPETAPGGDHAPGAGPGGDPGPGPGGDHVLGAAAGAGGATGPAPRRDRVLHIARAAVLGVAVAVLVAGAVLVARDGVGGGAADASERIGALYEQGDVEQVMDLVVPGSIAQGQEQAVAAALQQVLADRGVTVVDAATVRVDDVPVAHVQTSDGLAWCVRPDGMLLLGCRLGEVVLEPRPGNLPLQALFAAGDLYVDGAQLAVVLTTTGGTFTFDGSFQVVADGDGPIPDLLEVAYVTAGQTRTAPQSDVELGADRALLFRLGASTADARDELLADGLRLTWDGGALPIVVGEPTWFLS